jgi:hypothetical protein
VDRLFGLWIDNREILTGGNDAGPKVTHPFFNSLSGNPFLQLSRAGVDRNLARHTGNRDVPSSSCSARAKCAGHRPQNKFLAIKSLKKFKVAFLEEIRGAFCGHVHCVTRALLHPMGTQVANQKMPYRLNTSAMSPAIASALYKMPQSRCNEVQQVASVMSMPWHRKVQKTAIKSNPLWRSNSHRVQARRRCPSCALASRCPSCALASI